MSNFMQLSVDVAQCGTVAANPVWGRSGAGEEPSGARLQRLSGG